MSFSGDILAFERKVKRNASIIFKKVSFDTYGDIIRMTPVDTGRAKGNWQIAINRVPRGALDLEGIGVVGGGQALAVTEQLKLGDGVYIINNLPYIEKLENGHSQQAPNGMVKLAKLKFKRRVNAVARSIK